MYNSRRLCIPSNEPSSKTPRPDSPRSKVCTHRSSHIVSLTIKYRTHRERKEAYTKSLELEVIQLRANEAKIMQETKMLYAEITNLKSMLMRHGIEVPVSNISSAEEQTIVTDAPEFELYIPKTTTKGQHQRIHVQPKTARDRRRQQQPTGPREDSGELIDVSLSNFSLRKSPTSLNGFNN